MAQLTIPSRYRQALAKIISLPDGSIEEIIAELSKVSQSSNLMIASTVASRVKSVEEEDVRKIVNTVVSLYGVRGYSEPSAPSIEKFVDNICEAMRKTGLKELAVTEENEEPIKQRLKKFLNIEGFDVVSKAKSLQEEYEHLFCAARIFTDMRPVYGPDTKALPSAAVITNTLKLSYHEGSSGELKDIYISLDTDDIKKLRDLLDRAESKTNSLKALLESTKLPIFS